jgi:hypothetical protein
MVGEYTISVDVPDEIVREAEQIVDERPGDTRSVEGVVVDMCDLEYQLE